MRYIKIHSVFTFAKDEEIGHRKLENVLLIFYRDMPPEVEQDGFTTVDVQYNPTLDLFTELE